MRIVVATNNAGKIAELQRLLPANVTLLTLGEMGLQSPEENGETFVENALLKARHAAGGADAAIADDSGIVVDALQGEPGIRSARCSGPGATDESNNRELLRRLAGVPRAQRGARFVSAAAFVTRDGEERVTEGSIRGIVLEHPRGSNGFGFDPLFEIHDSDAPAFAGRTMAELSIEEKNAISHRGRAIRALVVGLRAHGLLAHLAADEVQE